MKKDEHNLVVSDKTKATSIMTKLPQDQPLL